MTPAGFEPVVPASERLQMYAVDSAVTGIGQDVSNQTKQMPNGV